MSERHLNGLALLLHCYKNVYINYDDVVIDEFARSIKRHDFVLFIYLFFLLDQYVWCILLLLLLSYNMIIICRAKNVVSIIL